MRCVKWRHNKIIRRLNPNARKKIDEKKMGKSKARAKEKWMPNAIQAVFVFVFAYFSLFRLFILHIPESPTNLTLRNFQVSILSLSCIPIWFA